MLRKNMTALNSPKTFYHYCIPVVAQYNCFSDLSLILADLFNISLKKSHFSYCWRVLFAVFVLKNNRERSMIRHNHSVSLPFVISKIFEELLKSRITDLLGKCFLWIQIWFQVISFDWGSFDRCSWYNCLVFLVLLFQETLQIYYLLLKSLYLI